MLCANSLSCPHRCVRRASGHDVSGVNVVGVRMRIEVVAIVKNGIVVDASHDFASVVESRGKGGSRVRARSNARPKTEEGRSRLAAPGHRTTSLQRSLARLATGLPKRKGRCALGCGCEIYGLLVVNPNSTNPVYTLPSPRGGAAATFVVDVIELNSATNLNITIEHQNRGDTAWSGAGSFTPITASGVHTLQVTGLKEKYRWALALGPMPVAGESYRVQNAVSWRP